MSEQRKEARRNIYLGERIMCDVMVKQGQISAELIDISPTGLAFVPDPKVKKKIFQIDERVMITLKKKSISFSIEALIKHIAITSIGGMQRRKIGVQFNLTKSETSEEFYRNIKQQVFFSSGYIRPQVSCRHPFFFKEPLYFQINGFFARGLELIISAHYRSLFPNLPLELDTYIPNRGIFKIKVVISNIQYRGVGSDKIRYFAFYVKPEPRFLHAISEYLCIFGKDVTGQKLRQAGFTIGNLDNAIEICFNHRTLKEETFKTTVISPPYYSYLTEKNPFHKWSRRGYCKVGSVIAASFHIIFTDGQTDRSELLAIGHKLPPEILEGKWVELSSFKINNEIVLTDFFLLLLKHLVRIGAQAGIKYLLLECTRQMIAILQKFGFYQLKSKVKYPGLTENSHDLYLMGFNINKVLAQRESNLEYQTWEILYKELNEYLNRTSLPRKVRNFNIANMGRENMKKK